MATFESYKVWTFLMNIFRLSSKTMDIIKLDKSLINKHL